MKTLIRLATLLGMLAMLASAMAQSARKNTADPIDPTSACLRLAYDPKENIKRKDILDMCAKAPRDMCENIHLVFKQDGIPSEALVCVGPR